MHTQVWEPLLKTHEQRAKDQRAKRTRLRGSFEAIKWAEAPLSYKITLNPALQGNILISENFDSEIQHHLQLYGLLVSLCLFSLWMESPSMSMTVNIYIFLFRKCRLFGENKNTLTTVIMVPFRWIFPWEYPIPMRENIGVCKKKQMGRPSQKKPPIVKYSSVSCTHLFRQWVGISEIQN